MSTHLRAYVDTQNKSIPVTDDPHAIIQFLYQELLNNVEKIIKLEVSKTETYVKSVSRALGIIYTLQTSLDFDKGGKISENLFTVYEFCRAAILEKNENNANEKLLTAQKLLKEIAGAWEQIPLKEIA